jgi:hypothetical protein
VKQRTAIGLLCALLLPALLIGLHLKLEKAALRSEIKHWLMEQTSREDLVAFTVDAAKAADVFDWEHESEFRYKGEMYDVVETEIIGNQIRYWCWHDAEESELEQRLNQLVAGIWSGDPERTDDDRLVQQFLKKLFAPDRGTTDRVRIPRFCAENIELKLIIEKRFTAPPTPPPNLKG